MRLLVLLATALLLTVEAQAQVYAPYEEYDGYGGYYYEDPYSPYPPPPYYEPAPRYREPLYDRRQPSTRGARGTIVIATREHTLVYTTASGEQFAYPIAVGREGKQWYGTTRVVSKRMHPEWRPTASMRQKNPRLPEVVKPGPANPLGTRAIYLADGLLRIHGTNDPSSIGTNASSGCFRMYREDVEELYDMVQPGTRVIVQW
ncbi:L,D-transpeptidase [Rhizobium mesosinicum]|uniref:L,D-transpeptidase n=1 Tax=Rhizobium mesosinicum TaxID=335017 RepID=A0ABS7GTA7_9HYPH|nr:L,D-transpeptidase [Rhizobium mesosinicum]MBW9052449.1 L,D-transpeptidase [Rhizobium mesosinicum]